MTAEETAATDRGNSLKQKVLKRAEQIRRAWKDVPDVPTAAPRVTAAEPDETGDHEDEETREAA